MGHLLFWLLSQPLFWALAGIGLGPYLFFRGFRLLQLKRRIMGVPRSTVRAAAMGPVEVSGTVVGPYTVVAPLSQGECLYYRIKVQSNPHRDLGNKSQELCAPLFLDDGTGLMMIYPYGAELKFPASYKRAEYGKLALMLMSRSYSETPEFSEEYSLRPGDKIFALGTLQENKWSRKEATRQYDDVSRIGPGFVCEAEAELERRETFPSFPGLALGPKPKPPEFDLNPPVIMTKGDGPFVISSGSERDLLTKLHWTSLLFIWGGPVWVLWAVWEILGDPRVWTAISGTR
jgi:hypothetical protein